MRLQNWAVLLVDWPSLCRIPWFLLTLYGRLNGVALLLLWCFVSLARVHHDLIEYLLPVAKYAEVAHLHLILAVLQILSIIWHILRFNTLVEPSLTCPFLFEQVFLVLIDWDRSILGWIAVKIVFLVCCRCLTQNFCFVRWHTSSHTALSILYIILDMAMLVQEWCSIGAQIGLKRSPWHRIIENTFVLEVRCVITVIHVEVAAVHFWYCGSMGLWLLIHLRLLDWIQIIAWGESLHALMVLSSLLS